MKSLQGGCFQGSLELMKVLNNHDGGRKKRHFELASFMFHAHINYVYYKSHATVF